MDSWVFDNVLPMDCVCMTKELILVNIYTSTQDLCEEKKKDTWALFYLSLSFFSQVICPDIARSSQTYSSTRYVRCFINFVSHEDKSRVRGWGEQLILRDTHLIMPVVERPARTKLCHIAVITTCDLFLFCCFCHPSLPVPWAERINYASCYNTKSKGDLSPSKGQQL